MTDLDELNEQIEEIWERSGSELDPAAVRTVESVIDCVDDGRLRCAQPADGGWQVNLWVKKAIALYFRIGPVRSTTVGPFEFRDRFPLKMGAEKGGFRIVPPGAARRGCYIGPGATLMPGYLNLGVWVGGKSLIDTWVSLGTCVQVGDRVTILPCTSVIGSLFPLDAPPAIIEDDCHIGSGCVIGAGVKVAQGAVLGSGVVLHQGIPVLELQDGEPGAIRAEIPPNALVVRGSTPVTGTSWSADAALIIGYRTQGQPPTESLRQALKRLMPDLPGRAADISPDAASQHRASTQNG
jgi:2,3,4,5-tetrahydropyridine-2-carboxylate N-succinyltransferase